MSHTLSSGDRTASLAFPVIKPVQRSRIVAEQLIAAIQEQRIQVGDKLPPEREMAKAMNVSRNTLREAIAALQLLGFFDVRRSSGIYLAKQPEGPEVLDDVTDNHGTFHDPFSALDARIAMEPGAAILAAKLAEPEDWEQLEKAWADMRTAKKEGSYPRYMIADTRFHKTMASATHNELVIQALAPIFDTMRKPVWKNLKTSIHSIHGPEVWGASFEEHRLILEALRSKDDYLIFRAVTSHLTHSRQRLAEKMLEME